MYYCRKVFQASNIEREIKRKRKRKRKRKQPQLHLSCALSVLHMASSIDVKKQTPHLIFNQYEWERMRVLSFLAFFNAWTQQLLPPNSLLNIYHLPVLHAWEISLLFFLYVLLPFTRFPRIAPSWATLFFTGSSIARFSHAIKFGFPIPRTQWMT